MLFTTVRKRLIKHLPLRQGGRPLYGDLAHKRPLYVHLFHIPISIFLYGKKLPRKGEVRCSGHFSNIICNDTVRKMRKAINVIDKNMLID